MNGLGITEIAWLVIMIVLGAYFFLGVDLIALVTGGAGKRKSVPDKVFGIVRFVMIALLAVFSALLIFLSIVGW